MKAQVQRPLQPHTAAFLSDRHFVEFGGLALMQSAQQSLTFENTSPQPVKVQPVVRPVSTANTDFQIVSSYLQKEIRVSSVEVLLNGSQQLLVTVKFCPSVVVHLLLECPLYTMVRGKYFSVSSP